MRRDDKPTNAGAHVYFSDDHDRTRKKRSNSGGSTSSTGSESCSSQKSQPQVHQKLKRALSENYQVQTRPLVLASSSSGWGKLKLLLWKNWVVQKRHKVQTLVEIALPVFFASLLVIIRDLAPAYRFSEATFYPPVDIGQMPNIPRNSLLPTGTNNMATVDPLNISSQLSASLLDESLSTFGFLKSFEWPLAWAPNNTLVQQVMETIGDKLGLEVKGHGFATEDEMVDYILSNYNGLLTGEKIDFLGGVVFTSDFLYNDTFPKDIKYKIRLKGNPRIKNEDRNPLGPAETWMTDYQYPFFQVPGPRNRNRSDGGSPGYYKEGFLAIQHAISMTISDMITGRQILDENIIVMRRFPYPPYFDDKFMVALQGWLPLIIMLSFIYPALNIVKSIVHEKERRLKESMKMMGLPNWLHWTAWFIKAIMFLIVTIGLITWMLKTDWFGQSSLAVLEKSDGTLFFVFLLVFTVTSISFCFLMTVFFSKANSAATGAGIIWFMTYCPYFFLQLRYTTLTRKDKLIACLLSNTAMAFAAQLISMFEGASAGIQWDTLFRGVSPDDEFTFGDVLVMLVIDAFIYLILALYIEAVFPGEYGVPKPWYFPLMRSYWCGESLEEVDPATPEISENRIPVTEFFEEEPHGLRAGIQIKGLTKVYRKGRAAVNNISMNMYESQITALLGHNGAGKTTTMSLLTGLFPPTSGTALVNGFDIRTDMGNVRGSLGLCPQHDVLFDELTVEEHLDFFCKLKGFPSNMVKAETDRMVKALQLEPKRNAQSKTLSGGMKRKLSVGIALCADSKVVMLDEPTSGMDPAARRSTWDLLQEEKAGRTILLTTHFMEEADLLGDRIAIMASGRTQCSGSSLFLKKKYGAGYHLVIVKEKHCSVNRITETIQKYIPETEIDQNVGAELSYVLPSEKSSCFDQLFTELEEGKVEFGISSYGASVTTMEEVFIKVGEKAEEADLTSEANSTAALTEIRSSYHTKDCVLDYFPTQDCHMDRFTKNASYSMSRLVDDDARKSGFSLRCQQFYSMLVKKALYTFRNWMLFAAQLVIPIIFLMVCLIVVQTIPGIEDSKPLTATLENYVGTTTTVEINATSDPVTAALYSSYINSPDFSEANKMIFVNARNSSVEKFYVKMAEEDVSWVNMHYVIGASFHEKRRLKGKRVITGWFNNQAFHTPALSLNLIHNALLRYYSLIPEYKITVVNHPLPYDDISKLNRDTSGSSLGFQVGFNIAFGMSFLTASFVIFLVKEKITKAKHLQFVSGVNSFIYWGASFLWDFANYMIPCVGILLTFLAFKEDGYISVEQQGRFVIVFLLFGWAMLPLIYLLSFFFTIPSTGFTRITMFNLFTGLASMITVMILQIPELDLGYAADLVHWVFLALPSYSLGMAFSNLYTNVKAVEFCTKDIVQMACKTGFMPNPCCKEQGNCGSVPCIQWNTNILGWDGLGVGKELVFLAVDGAIFLSILFLIETKLLEKLRYWLMKKKAELDARMQQDDPEMGGDMNVMDTDVEREKEYIQLTPVSSLNRENTLVIRDMTKFYPGNFLAVDKMCLGVRRGEVFGLLGVNGAGKTTTFKMLTGDETISAGDCFLESFSVKRSIKEVQQRLGYCPQFDAVIEEMTGRETLRMFARLRGVEETRIDYLIEDLSERLLLTLHVDKQIKELSGGNKRKLSTAVALVGDPPIVFLDEPTTGMDPVARRQLWDVITRVRDNGQAVVITSHSMEECEALCTRIAIMVNGQMKCLGSAQHLKSRFGQGYTLIAKVRGATAENPRVPLSRTMSGPAASFRSSIRQRTAGAASPKNTSSAVPSSGHPPDMGRLMDFIQLNFPGCQLKDYHQGLVHYHLPENGLSWAKIFGLMESAKNKYSIEDYSVGQTTLEQVFLNFAKSQSTDE